MSKYAGAYLQYKDMQNRVDATSQKMPLGADAGSKSKLDEARLTLMDGEGSEAAVPVGKKLRATKATLHDITPPTIEASSEAHVVSMVARQPADTVDLEELRGSRVSNLMLAA